MRGDGVLQQDGTGETPFIRLGGHAFHQENIFPGLRECRRARDDILMTHAGERELHHAVFQAPRVEERHGAVHRGITEQLGVAGFEHEPGAYPQTERGEPTGEITHTDERREFLPRMDEAERRVLR